EVATPLVVLVCVALFVLPRGRAHRNDARGESFFARLHRPLTPAEIPQLDPGFGFALRRLFGLSFLVAGGFFVVVSVFTVASLGGQLALSVGLGCMLMGAIILFVRADRTPIAA